MAIPERATKVPLDVKIVGAGISGLSAAISCALAGHHVQILEAAKELAEIGAGFQITPNGSRVLHQYGVLDKLAAKAADPTVFAIRRWSDGKVLAWEEDFNVNMNNKYNAPFWDLHRVDVQRVLADRARELGVEVRLGCRVEDVEFEHATLTLATGETVQADLLVGADGMWSVCRARFMTAKGLSPDAPRPTGDLAYRIVLNIEDVQDPEVRQWISKPSCQFWYGPSSHVVAYSIRNATMSNIVLLVPDDLPADVARQPGSLDEMKTIFAQWDPMLNRFLKEVKTVDKWKLMHAAELDSWINEQSNFVFVGDACHSMVPYLAQGANSSLEDGAVLGNVLAALESKSQLPEALQLYEQLRKKRGETMARLALAQRNDCNLHDGPEQQARDELMLSKLGKQIDCNFPSRFLDPEVQSWLFKYDAKEEVDRALQQTPLARCST